MSSAATHPNNPPLESLVMEVAETARLLRISRRSLERRMARGQAPAHIRIGNRIVFLRDTVMGWLVANERGKQVESPKPRGQRTSRRQRRSRA